MLLITFTTGEDVEDVHLDGRVKFGFQVKSLLGYASCSLRFERMKNTQRSRSQGPTTKTLDKTLTPTNNFKWLKFAQTGKFRRDRTSFIWLNTKLWCETFEKDSRSAEVALLKPLQFVYTSSATNCLKQKTHQLVRPGKRRVHQLNKKSPQFVGPRPSMCCTFFSRQTRIH